MPRKLPKGEGAPVFRVIQILVLFVLAAAAALSCSSTEERDVEPPPPPKEGEESGAKTAAEGVGLSYSGRALELRGDLEGAAQAYRKALKNDPASALLTRSLSRVLYKAGNAIEAIGVLSRYLESRSDATVHLYLIDLFDRMGSLDQAEKEVRKILSYGPIPREVGEILSARILQIGDALGAADILKAIKAPLSDPSLPATLAGELLLDRGYFEEAKAFFLDAMKKNPAGRAALGLAAICAQARDWKGAATKALDYVRKNAREVWGILRLGDYLVNAGEVKEATRWLEEAADGKKRPEDVFPALARAYRRLGDREKALEAYRTAVSHNPREIPLIYELGTLLEETGAIEEAEKVLGSAARQSGGAPFTSHYLAFVWAQLGIRLEEAEGSAREAVKSDPEVGAYHAVLGFVLSARGKPEEARASFERAAGCDPDPFVHRVTGDFLAKTGQMKKAVESWRKAQSLDPRLEEWLESKIREAGG
ncbi:MAG: tetratricopeptide repeat protein [Planctomycetota bacterium]|jgi:tetratricopeptide (TPR) repeat protein